MSLLNNKLEVEEDDDESMGKKPIEFFTSKVVSSLYELYITDTMEEPRKYSKIINTIRNMSEMDVLKIYINSHGGYMDTGLQFLRVLQDTKARVVISVDSLCASAATILLMCGDDFEISNHSRFMFHDYSGGTIGKGGEMFDQIMAERLWAKTLFEDIYKDFLSSKELEVMMSGKDIWLTGKEVCDRLSARSQKLAEAAKAAE